MDFGGDNPISEYYGLYLLLNFTFDYCYLQCHHHHSVSDYLPSWPGLLLNWSLSFHFVPHQPAWAFRDVSQIRLYLGHQNPWLLDKICSLPQDQKPVWSCGGALAHLPTVIGSASLLCSPSSRLTSFCWSNSQVCLRACTFTLLPGMLFCIWCMAHFLTSCGSLLRLSPLKIAFLSPLTSAGFFPPYLVLIYTLSYGIYFWPLLLSSWNKVGWQWKLVCFVYHWNLRAWGMPGTWAGLRYCLNEWMNVCMH